MTNWKLVQLWTAAASLMMGFFVNLMEFDSSLFFYACFAVTAICLIRIMMSGFRRFWSVNREVLLIMTVMLISIAVNLKYSDVYSLIRWMEMLVLMCGSMIYSGKEDMTVIRKHIRMIFRMITIVTFIFSAGSVLLAFAGQALADQGMTSLFAVSIERVLKWNKDMRNMVLGGLYTNGNLMGINAYCSAVLSWYFLRGHRKALSFDGINFLLQVISVILSGCRSVMIGSLFTVILLLPKKNRKSRLLAGVLLAAAAAVLIFVTLTKSSFIHSGEGVLLLLNKITGNRAEIWGECLEMFRNHKLFGIGLGNVNQAGKLILGEECLIYSHWYTNAHNLLINILVMTGIAGLIAFSFLMRDCVDGLKKTDRVLGVMCYAFILMDMFDIFLIFTDKFPTLLFCMIAGYGIALQRSGEKPFYFFSNLVEEDIYRSLYTKEERPGQQAQKFNRLIAEGFLLNGRQVECDTSVLASDAIVDYKVKKLKNHGMYRYALSLNLPGIKTIWNVLAAFFRVLYAEYGACVIDVLSIDNAVGALAASRLRGMPDTGIVTDLPEHFSGDGLYAKIVYRIMDWCGSYVFLTEYMDEKLNPKHKPYIVMEGLCDVSVKPEISSCRNKSIIFAGEIDEQNGVITLIDAFNAWGDHGYDLYYYGSGEAMDLLKEKASGNPRVHLMGVVFNRELLKIMKDASLLVNPRPVHQDFVKYSFPSKVMEYMNTGTYHASSHLACIPEEYFAYIGDLGDGSAEDILKFLKQFENMPQSYTDEQARKAQEFVLTKKNNKVQSGRIADLLDGMYL